MSDDIPNGRDMYLLTMNKFRIAVKMALMSASDVGYANIPGGYPQYCYEWLQKYCNTMEGYVLSKHSGMYRMTWLVAAKL